MNLTKEIMYKAIVEKDTCFEGVFFTAVITTGIFCRPSCTARKPKIENVEFFPSVKQCMDEGYRPCKVCKPLSYLNETPDEIRVILEELRQDSSLKLKDVDLKKRGIEPSQIRRWFLKNHGVTFHTYQRTMRINFAYKKIKEGERVGNTAYDMGYESLSGFNESFKNAFGVSPKYGKDQQVIDLQHLETPLGTIVVCATAKGICLLEFADITGLEKEFSRLSKQKQAVILQGDNSHITHLQKELAVYFSGACTVFTVALDLIGTEFQQKVWYGLLSVPYGETRTYKEQSEYLKIPKSIRAVANANGMNRIAILIPCHRIIGADSGLTGYRGGIWRKKYLLDLENRDSNMNHQLVLNLE
ncbi:bifunctional transcriptional activator/DNA repair enzyme AdaA [Myroides sp. N17-2]|uniref:bifunctional transcriptional activator/DNA repair enzyme AdaA n=1 Tax=Myroides sp. N17-2 TaxID=2030799 RepID=UPI00156D72F0|nr:methylated-DNA--[protein]-cysteine S-methyltransferase [Myroides sp. N17-2]